MSKQFTLRLLSDRDFQQTEELLSSDAMREASENYFHYVFSAAHKYLSTGDVHILNRAMDIARIMMRVRVTARLFKLVAAHDTNSKGKFIGKANKQKLADRLANVDKWKAKMEDIIANDAEVKAAKAANPFDDEQGFKQLSRIVGKYVTELGFSPEQVRAVLTEVADQVAPAAEEARATDRAA